MRTPFRFKQFTVHQDRCAMKIGTDGVLLGAWATLNHQPNTVLDIGAGTGVIALMLAQRSPAEIIDAVEFEANAYVQCVENFENSPWSDRLFCYHADFRDFASEMEERYQLIISNPPFFEPHNKVASKSSERDKARFTDSLPHQELLSGVDKLLAENGKFCTILPNQSEAEFIAQAKAHHLFPEKITRVKGTPTASIKRSLLCLSRTPSEGIKSTLTLEIERHRYTPEYKALLKDFYLKL